ncbi:serine protease gd isoform X2 [Drosophila guanche]|uniref:Blast:Serine protease gd n=1 Tax=Drosophila guanche TaxID=7266 RepID=A0A3B0KS71_DROGU|nr:serine protease gd isoform X2 [Drosophila guanche]SPP88756.1 blast:Serine protease gd [Drosophila guanche]
MTACICISHVRLHMCTCVCVCVSKRLAKIEMKLHFTTILLICFEHVSKVIAQGMPISPCPKIFQYRFDGNEWFGLIAVRNPDMRQPLQLRVTLSMRGKPTTNYLGEIELLTRGQFTKNAPVLYKIRFPKHHFPPKLLLISANNHVICFGSGDHSIFMTQIQLEHTRKLTFIPDKKTSLLLDEVEALPKSPPPVPPRSQFKKKPFHSPKEICGKIDSSLDFRLPLSSRRSDAITSPVFADNEDPDDEEFEHLSEEELQEQDTVDGSAVGSSLPSITRGSWPWLAAIYVNNLTSLDFQCGGTLVSSRVVISSGHCFRMFNKRYTANEVLVFLGRHNLKNWNEEGSLAAPVDGIYIHPDFNSQLSSYDADIAVILLKDEVRFNTFIRPACLWSGSSKSEYIVGEHGIVIGWSFDRSNATQQQQQQHSQQHLGEGKKATDTSIPKVVKAPIVANGVCFKANSHFRSLSSNRTFCAGIQLESREPQSSSSRLYTGISGAGLMILKNSRWMLRGTVSAALPPALELGPAGSTNCCSNQYIIYADVAKFIDWITAFII